MSAKTTPRFRPETWANSSSAASNVMRGYWQMPEETDRVLRPGPIQGEKVFYTGDLFRQDDEGFLYFVGRVDDVIKSRGREGQPSRGGERTA